MVNLQCDWNFNSQLVQLKVFIL